MFGSVSSGPSPTRSCLFSLCYGSLDKDVYKRQVFFSPDLCAHYFTYMSRETGAHFILFDDGESLEKKRTLAQELGISRFFLLYPEIAEFLPRLVRQEA